MGDPNTGRIYELDEGQQPEAGHVPLTADEAGIMGMLPTAERIKELQRMAREREGGAGTATATATAPEPVEYGLTDRTRQQVENAFTYHPPLNDEQRERYEAVRENFKSFAYYICSKTPPSREQSLALTKLEEAMFWTNAGIARNEKGKPPTAD